MFGTLSRSWQFAKDSYGVLWRCKSLLWFPILSSIAAVLVSASFLLPLWQSGALAGWLAASGDEHQAMPPTAYVVAFLFYFCNYFVIVFFNAALIASSQRYLEQGQTSLGYGLRMAGRRLGPIVGWALVSAVVGVVLRAIENSHKRAAQVVAAILGMAWGALTYFVIPVIVLEGVGPVQAFKRSTRTLKDTWGTALVGNFSLGLLGFLLMLPIMLICVLVIMGFGSLPLPLGVFLLVVCGVLLALGAAATSAADVIFKGLLYTYATGRTLPPEVNRDLYGEAFLNKRGGL